MFFNLNILLLITFLCGSLASQELGLPMSHSNCPRVDAFNHQVMLPDYQDCTKYYSCLNGMAYPQKCPYNFHWSTTTQRCDYPEIAKCHANAPLPTVLPTSLPIYALYPSNPEINYQLYTNDCNKYYKCEAHACPSNLYWNSYMQQCDFPHLAHCPFMPTAPITETTLTNIPTAPLAASTPIVSLDPSKGIPCPECVTLCEGTAHLYLPYQPDCHKFIQCNGWAYLHTCPDNLLWNAQLNTCDRFCVPA